MKITIPIIAAFLISMMVGAFMTWAAWQQNAQGEVYDDTGIHFDFLLTIFGSWAGLAMGVISPFLIGWLFIKSRRDQRRTR